MHPTIRASDADRERVVAELQRHVGTGRLTLEEFSERAGTAYRATTMGELAQLRRDLPTVQEGRPNAGGRRHHTPAAAVVAATVLSLVLGGAVLAAGAAMADTSPTTVSGEMCH